MIEFFLLIHFVLSGQVCLQKGWIFKWKFQKSTIEFSFVFDKLTLEKFDFVAHGPLIDVKDGKFEADVVPIFFKGRIGDGFNFYGDSGYDSEFGYQDDIFRQSFDPTTYTYTWQRPLITPEANIRKDFYYAPGVSANWFFDAGTIVDGVIQSFPFGDRQLLYFTLDDKTYFCDKPSFLQID